MILRLTKGLITGALLLYSIPLTAWLLLRWWQGESWTSVAYMNAVGVWWFAPLLVLLPLALLVRARQASVMSLLLLLPALLLFGPDFIPPLTSPEAEGLPRLRVLTFNALISNTSYEAVEAMVRTEQPDIIAIQELSPELAADITARVGAEYPYQLLYPWTDPRGIGLWSRYPLVEGPVLDWGYWEHWLQSAIVDVEGHPVHLVNVHLWPIGTLDQERFAIGLEAQQGQTQALRALVAASQLPVLVVGDFNASPTNESYLTLDEVMDDAWRRAASGPGFTYPSPGAMAPWSRPFLRIDYLWSAGAIAPLSVRVLPNAGSDHLPLLGDFVLTPP